MHFKSFCEVFCSNVKNATATWPGSGRARRRHQPLPPPPPLPAYLCGSCKVWHCMTAKKADRSNFVFFVLGILENPKHQNLGQNTRETFYGTAYRNDAPLCSDLSNFVTLASACSKTPSDQRPGRITLRTFFRKNVPERCSSVLGSFQISPVSSSACSKTPTSQRSGQNTLRTFSRTMYRSDVPVCSDHSKFTVFVLSIEPPSDQRSGQKTLRTFFGIMYGTMFQCARIVPILSSSCSARSITLIFT